MSSRTQSLDLLLKAFACGETVGPRVARDSGYDTYVLERAMELANPLLPLFSNYKPLAVWIRDNENTELKSRQDLKQYKDALQLMQLFVAVHKPDDRMYAMKTVEVYVCRDGRFLVVVSEKPNELQQEMYPKRKERIAKVIECATATDIGKVLNPMLLQWDRFADYDERFRVASPLLIVADNLRKECNKVSSSLKADVSKLEKAQESMCIGITTA